MPSYKLSNDAKMDLAYIYWRGVNEFGEVQADIYLQSLLSRFEEIAEAPSQYQAVDHIREGYRRSVCGVDSIYYRIDNDTVEVMRILGRQDVVDTL